MGVCVCARRAHSLLFGDQTGGDSKETLLADESEWQKLAESTENNMLIILLPTPRARTKSFAWHDG